MKPDQLAGWALAVPRPAKRTLAVTFDAALCLLTFWLALSLRLEHLATPSGNQWWAMAATVTLALPLFVVNGFYRAIFRYAGWNAMLAVVRAVAVYGLLYALLFSAVGVAGVPRSVGVTQPLMLMAAVGGSRVLLRYWLGGLYREALQRQELPGVLIFGAGNAGRQLARALKNMQGQRLVGFMDDDERLHRNHVDGWPVYNPADLPALYTQLRVKDVLLAIPSAPRERRMQLLEQLRHLPLHVRTLPGMDDLVSGRVSMADLKELDIEDLLGREAVAPNGLLINRNTHNKVVMVTGAGGSIGSELCRQIARCQPTKLLLVERSEFALYNIDQELKKSLLDHKLQAEFVPLLADVGDEARMQEIMATWRPHTVYHAAAYKHVPLVEHNPAEGIRNNVWGTLVCAMAAARCGVQSFVLVSTDKAVRPTNVMGASKRLTEMVLQALNEANPAWVNNDAVQGTRTCFSMVRFGNVLGSSGSVVPLFREQIKAGGPITLTHPDINRFFMTIPEAAQLVVQAGAMATGGDVFVLDMGQPVRIYDLAVRMVELSGLTVRDELNPNGEIEIRITGLRPGEKLFEELLIGDNPKPTRHPRIMKAHEDCLPWNQLQGKLNTLQLALDVNDVSTIKAMLAQLVSGYQPANGVVDWVQMAQEREVLGNE